MAQRDEFKDWFVAQANLCRETIDKYAKVLSENWVKQGLGGNSHPDFLRAEAKEMITEYWLHERQDVGLQKIGQIILHQPRDNLRSSRTSLCGAPQRKTFFFYKAKGKVAVCQRFFLTSLGYHKNAHFSDLKTLPCDECSIKSSQSLKQEK